MTTGRVGEGVTEMEQARGPAADLERIGLAVRAAGRDRCEAPDPAEYLLALTLLRQVREQLGAWEPELIDAARASGASWADIAPALGVASRQAAERRALRLRPSGDAGAVTGDERVSAERDRRAQVRAVDSWARDRSANLRVLAAQVGGLTDLPLEAEGSMTALHTALGNADAAALLQPLLEARPHLGVDQQGLADRIDALSGDAETVRADTKERRRH